MTYRDEGGESVHSRPTADVTQTATPATVHASATNRTNHQRAGDANWSLAQKYAERMNASEFATTLRDHKLPRHRYLGFISSVYPVVVGFNRALIRSICKVDHVRQSSFVRSLARQLQEEQSHNQLWREMLTTHGIDHEKLYQALETYLAGFTPDELDRMTEAVLARITQDIEDVAPGVFPAPPFPEPVLALYHRLWMTASQQRFDYWEHFACQSGIEAIIYQIVSTSLYPGVVGNPELDAGPVANAWGREHAKQGSTIPGKRIDEEKHLELARIALNRDEKAQARITQILNTAEEAMRLFAATMICHDQGKGGFDIEPHLAASDQNGES